MKLVCDGPGKSHTMSAVIEIVARKLGGPAVLGRDIQSQADLALVVRQRLPLDALKGLATAGLTQREIDFVIPQRTRRRRATLNQPLTTEESDRAVRLLRIQTLAESAFGEPDLANAWLRRPLHELNGAVPFDLSRTEAGARVIEKILATIAWGAAA